MKRDGVTTYNNRVELYRKNPELFAKIEYALVDAYNRNSDILNKDVVASFEMAIKTQQSQDKGLVYKHKSTYAVINDLADMIEKEIVEFKKKPDMSLTTIGGFIKEVLEDFLDEANFYSDQDADKNTYLTHLARYHKDRPGSKAAKSQIIL